MFIYFCPLAIIIPIYLRIVHFTKQHTFVPDAPNSVTARHRQHRELRFIRRLLIIVAVIFFMSFPYLIFFLRAQFFPRAKQILYAQRVSFVFLSFGYGLWMLLNLIFTDKVRKNAVQTVLAFRCCVPTRQVKPHNPTNPTLRTITTGPVPT